MAEKTEERIALEERAKNAGVKFQDNIGDEKLLKRVEDAEAQEQKPPSGDTTQADIPPGGADSSTATGPQGDNPEANGGGGGQPGPTIQPDAPQSTGGAAGQSGPAALAADGGMIPMEAVERIRLGGKVRPRGYKFRMLAENADALLKSGAAIVDREEAGAS